MSQRKKEALALCKANMGSEVARAFLALIKEYEVIAVNGWVAETSHEGDLEAKGAVKMLRMVQKELTAPDTTPEDKDTKATKQDGGYT